MSFTNPFRRGGEAAAPPQAESKPSVVNAREHAAEIQRRTAGESLVKQAAGIADNLATPGRNELHEGILGLAAKLEEGSNPPEEKPNPWDRSPAEGQIVKRAGEQLAAAQAARAAVEQQSLVAADFGAEQARAGEPAPPSSLVQKIANRLGESKFMDLSQGGRTGPAGNSFVPMNGRGAAVESGEPAVRFPDTSSKLEGRTAGLPEPTPLEPFKKQPIPPPLITHTTTEGTTEPPVATVKSEQPSSNDSEPSHIQGTVNESRLPRDPETFIRKPDSTEDSAYDKLEKEQQAQMLIARGETLQLSTDNIDVIRELVRGGKNLTVEARAMYAKHLAKQLLTVGTDGKSAVTEVASLIEKNPDIALAAILKALPRNSNDMENLLKRLQNNPDKKKAMLWELVLLLISIPARAVVELAKSAGAATKEHTQ